MPDVSISIDVPTLKEYFPYEGEDIRMVIELAGEFIADTDRRLTTNREYHWFSIQNLHSFDRTRRVPPPFEGSRPC